MCWNSALRPVLIASTRDSLGVTAHTAANAIDGMREASPIAMLARQRIGGAPGSDEKVSLTIQVTLSRRSDEHHGVRRKISKTTCSHTLCRSVWPAFNGMAPRGAFA